MGEYADMILDGQTCQDCGVFMGMAVGYPRTCRGCKRMEIAMEAGSRKPTSKNSTKVNCPTCNKRVKSAGLNDHLREAHGEQEVSQK